MPAPFPYVCSATVHRTSASRTSPEELVLSSLGTCMLTTFEAFAARDGIQLLEWSANARGEVDHTPDGLMFTSIVLVIEMEIAGNVEAVDCTIEDTKRYCPVLNSLRVPVVIETEIRTDDHQLLDLAG